MRKLKNKKRKNKNQIFIYLFVILVIMILLQFLLIYFSKSKEERGVELKKLTPVNLSESSVSLYVPAVDSEGEGVPTLLSVDVTKGKGRVLVDIDGLLFWADTQQSIRMAKLVAENITGKKASNYDFIYNIKANASVIGGPSAGAALTISTIAALEGKKLRKDVMITGTINHDGTIGPVDGIYAKAQAAKKAGAKIFLVPLLQSKDVTYKTEKHCEKFGFSEICTSETLPQRIDLNEEFDINVTEVRDVQEAMNYFFS